MHPIGRLLRAGLAVDHGKLGTAFGNLALRGTTSVSRFALMLGMAHFLTLADLGLLGLVMATVNLTSTGLGLNFFQFNTREILKSPRETWPRMIRDQGILHLLTYAAAAPLFVGSMAIGLLPWAIGLKLVGIVLLDHLGLELQRLLVVLSRPLFSSLVLFLRSGLWAYLAVALIAFVPALRTIETIWWCWSAGAAAAVALGIWAMRALPWRQELGRFDRAWVRRGVRSALLLLGGLACLRAIFAVDRQLLQIFLGLEAVGAYTFFSGVANTMMVLTESGVLLTHYPRLVASFQAGDLATYRRTTHQMVVGSVVLASALAAAIVIAIRPLLGWIGEQSLVDALPVLWVLLVAMALQVGAQLVRNALYVRELDWSISGACGVGLIVAVVSNVALIPPLGPVGAAGATSLAMAAMIGASWLLLARAPSAMGDSGA